MGIINNLLFNMQGMNIKVRKNVIHILANSSNDKIMKIESYQHTHCFILILTSPSELFSHRSVLKYERSIDVYIRRNKRRGVIFSHKFKNRPSFILASDSSWRKRQPDWNPTH